MDYKIHPACAAFPDLCDQEFSDFKASLKANGQLEPCWTYKGWLIDGKNRVRGLTENHQGIDYQEWEPVSQDTERIEQEIKDFVMAKNLEGRRHLSTGQRALIAARLAEIKHGGDHTSEQGLNSSLAKTQRKTAEKLGVSRSSAQVAHGLLQKAATEIIKAVETGEVSLHKASKIAKLPKGKQKAALAAEKVPETPFDEALAGCDWVLKHAVPKVQEHALEVERRMGKAKGDFAAGRIMGAMKTVFNQFDAIRGVVAHSRNKHLERQK